MLITCKIDEIDLVSVEKYAFLIVGLKHDFFVNKYVLKGFCEGTKGTECLLYVDN